MNISIIGLPKSGKTTIFNAATRGKASVSEFSSKSKPNIGVAKVPDSRLNRLADIFNPKKITQSEVTYIDIPTTPETTNLNKGISGEYLVQLQKTDVLMIATRAFENPSVPDNGDGIDHCRDIETVLFDLTFVDLEILERRLIRIQENLKGSKSTERDRLEKEMELITVLRKNLEDGNPIRSQSLTVEQEKIIEGFRFLTAKPVIIVANISENDLNNTEEFENNLNSRFGEEQILITTLCGKLEMDLAQMDLEDEKDFRTSLLAGESGLDRMIRLSYEALNQLTFFTCGPEEVRAWAVTKGVTAPQASGKIHTDMERGFIRAEVVAYDDIIRCKSMAEARNQGVLRQEGKSYIVHEADVMLILFNL
jgi:GTP-binding protein YchF